MESKSLDEIANEIDEKLDAFELQVASMMELAKHGYPPKRPNEKADTKTKIS